MYRELEKVRTSRTECWTTAEAFRNPPALTAGCGPEIAP